MSAKYKHMIKESLFYGKILLFGEYGIIEDSMGLSIPYNFYKGKLIFECEDDELRTKSNESLLRFHNYLKGLQDKGELLAPLNLDEFKSDLEEGMLFESTIPQGFGVGSSGALVAAIYDKYAAEKVDSKENVGAAEIVDLKKMFGQMESLFHGTSSGLDPLICYLNLPILIKSKTEVGTVGLPEEGKSNGAIFLLNTGTPGETQPMVNIFLDKLKEKGFRTVMKQEFKKYNDACIEAFLKRDFKPLLSNVKQLSKVAFDHFKPMIPNVFHKMWKDGIDSNAYYLKLCGSGGGGFILGFTEDIDVARTKLKDYELDVIYSF